MLWVELKNQIELTAVTIILHYLWPKPEEFIPSLCGSVWVHSTSIGFILLFPLLHHLQFWFHLCAAKCVSSNTWQVHWTCTGSPSELQRVTDGRHTTLVRLLMFNSDCNTFFLLFFFQPAIQLFSSGPRLQHPGELERAVVLSRGPLCPSPSTFASVEHSIYFIAPLHLIALTPQIPLESNEMAMLMSVSMWTGETSHPVGIFRRGA